MPARIPDDIRAAILADVRAGEKSCRSIARDHRVSSSTVSALAREAGIDDAFERTNTKKAIEATHVDNKARRAALSARLIARAEKLERSMDEPHLLVKIGGKDNIYTGHLMARPDTAAIKDMMVSIGIAVDKHRVLELHDGDPGVDGAKSMLGALAAGLALAHERIRATGDGGS